MPATDSTLLVLDTNVALDLLWFDDAAARPLAAALDAGRCRLLSAPAPRQELQHQLASPRLARWCRSPDAVTIALQRYDGWCALGRWADNPAPLPQPCLRCTDVDDQIFLELALAHGAGTLLSRDRALLKLARKAKPLGLRIATPIAWLQPAVAGWLSA
jgi:uncharacterized protein